MRMVNIVVDAEVKDELSRLADERGISVDAVVRELLVRGRRDERFAEMSNAVEMNPPDSSYFAELRDWESEAWD
ncbi:hypothetical protein [Actinomyces oris]|uniref:hypothetical protein n=1 Tax=Actinomyces oris TaxID=544580 RepID=UPI0028E2231F|nr:hypothetical protein [Actinomyces oris]